MNKTKEPIYISFATQKGGAGKTTFTILAASWLHYKMGFNVAVMDCDYPQNSIVGLRERELAHVSKSDALKFAAAKHFGALGKKAYPVIQCNVQRALEFVTEGNEDVEKIIAEAGFEDKIDVVLFDLPGTINHSEYDAKSGGRVGIMSLIACMDYIFCPITNDRSVIESSIATFAAKIQENIIEKKQGTLKDLFVFWTEVDGRENSPIYGALNKLFKKTGFSLMNAMIPTRTYFKKELSDEPRDIFKSTLFPAANRVAEDSKLVNFMDELTQKIKLSHQKMN